MVPTITHTGTLTFPSPYSITVNDFNTTNGRMTWFGAMAWAEWLNFGGYDNWRLPTTSLPCFDYNCTDSEMGHMFYNNLGGNVGQSVLNQTDDTDQEKANLALFDNVQSNVYWSGTEYAPDTRGAWYFNANLGNQGALIKDVKRYAWAVRPGDVAAAPPSIPEPGSLTLVGLGLLALGAARRRRG